MKKKVKKSLSILGLIFILIGLLNILFVLSSITISGVIKMSAMTFERHVIIGLSMVMIGIGMMLTYIFTPFRHRNHEVISYEGRKMKEERDWFMICVKLGVAGWLALWIIIIIYYSGVTI